MVGCVGARLVLIWNIFNRNCCIIRSERWSRESSVWSIWPHVSFLLPITNDPCGCCLSTEEHTDLPGMSIFQPSHNKLYSKKHNRSNSITPLVDTPLSFLEAASRRWYKLLPFNTKCSFIKTVMPFVVSLDLTTIILKLNHCSGLVSKVLPVNKVLPVAPVCESCVWKWWISRGTEDGRKFISDCEWDNFLIKVQVYGKVRSHSINLNNSHATAFGDWVTRYEEWGQERDISSNKRLCLRSFYTSWQRGVNDDEDDSICRHRTQHLPWLDSRRIPNDFPHPRDSLLGCVDHLVKVHLY